MNVNWNYNFEVNDIKEGQVIAKGPCPTDQKGK